MIRAPLAATGLDAAWKWCPACGNDRRKAHWRQPGTPGS